MPAGDALEERIAAWRGGGEAPAPVVIAGSVTRDLVHRQGRTTAQIGGTVWYAGLTLSRLGFPVRAVTRLAAADCEIAAALADAGIEARIAPSEATTLFHNHYGGSGRDDRRQVVEAVAAPIAGDALAAALADAGGLCYLGPLHPDDLSAEAVAVAAGLEGVPVAVDVQGYTRQIVEDRVVATLAPDLAQILDFADVVKAGAGEACLIADASTPADAVVRLAEGRGTTEVLVTDGARGVHLAVGGEVHRQPAPALADVDPTGAGDIFLAAYLAGRLIGEPPEGALRLAVDHAAGRLADPAGRRRLTV